MSAQAINFTRGVPAIESFPVDELIDAAGTVLKEHAASVLQYGPALGFLPMRQWLAEWQGVTVDQVLTGNGSLELIEFLCRQTIRPGDCVFTESPTYDRTITLLRRHGADVVGIALEADGPDIAALENALAKRVPKFFYVIPDFQNPSGATCSAAKRRRIVELAEKHGFLLVEDAPYRLLRYRGSQEPTLFELAPQRTLHMSSFTKLIATGCSHGLHARRTRVAQEDRQDRRGHLHFARLRRARSRLRVVPPRPSHAADRAVKKLYAPRLDACLAAIDKYMPEAVATRPDGGFFLSLTLPEGISTTKVRDAATKRQLNLADGLAFFRTAAASASCGCRTARLRRRKSMTGSGDSQSPSEQLPLADQHYFAKLRSNRSLIARRPSSFRKRVPVPVKSE